MGVVETDGNTNDGAEELADQHTQSSPDKKRATAELLNGVEGDWGGADVDQGEDKRDQEGVLDRAGRLQERCGVVKDEVDTSPTEIMLAAVRRIPTGTGEHTIVASFEGKYRG